MNSTAQILARVAAFGVVIVAAAALGLAVGNFLNSRDNGGLDAGAGPRSMHMGSFDGVRNAWLLAEAQGTPSYADPYLQITSAAEAGNEATPQTWGNIDERRDPAAADGAPTYADPYREFVDRVVTEDDEDRAFPRGLELR